MTEEKPVKCVRTRDGSAIPWLPVAGRTDPVPTPHVARTLYYAERPRLLQEHSWTKSVPYKDWYEYVKPMEGIGSMFTPTSYKFCIKNLAAKRQLTPWHPFGPDGKLKYPPIECVRAHHEEISKIDSRKSKRLKVVPDNVINLKDLADGTWARRKAEKLRAQSREREERIEKRRRERRANKIPERVVSAEKDR